MRFYAQTIVDHIIRQATDYSPEEGAGGRLLFMMPSIPIRATLELCGRLEDYCLEQESLATPVIKIARQLWEDEWERSPDDNVQAALADIREEWRDHSGNLTSHRNASAGVNKPMIVLLIGTDRITDAAGLADFHHCDHQTVWHQMLGKSFASWSRAALDEAHVASEKDTPDHFDDILCPLIEKGLADFLQISNLLEDIDFASVQDGRDAERLLLDSLGRFNLPLFTGYNLQGRKSFGPYLDSAVGFFSYNDYIEDQARKKALKAINAFKEKYFPDEEDPGEDLFDQAERLPFDSDRAFVDAVEHYLSSADTASRDALMQCDFVTVRDRILGYKEPKEKTKKPKPTQKLSGSPIEVILTGLWATLGDFKTEAADQGCFAHEAISRIEIGYSKDCVFKHDCDGDSSDDRTERARAYLNRLLGGIDYFLTEYVQIPLSDDPESSVPVQSGLESPEINCQPSRTAEPCLEFAVTIEGEGLDVPVIRKFAWRMPETHPYRVAAELFKWAGEAINEWDGYCLPVVNVPYYQELMLANDSEDATRVLRHCIQEEESSLLNMLDVDGLDSEDPLLKPTEALAFRYDKFVQEAASRGLHAALHKIWQDLRGAYEEVCDLFITDDQCGDSCLAAPLFRSFLIIRRRNSAEGNRWIWEGLEPSGIVTVLHPALIEMLEAHIQYLLTSFNSVAVAELRSPDGRAFRTKTWQNYLDLAQMQMPLTGLLKGHPRDLQLDTTIRGEALIHRIGSAKDMEASLTTRLLLRYEDTEDESISDADMFRESRESALMFQVLKDYYKLHPHAEDGLSIAVYQNEDIQPVIAAIDEFLRFVCDTQVNGAREYAMLVTVFTESTDDAGIARWMAQWQERWESAETQESLARYRRVHLSVAHRIVESKDYYKQFVQIIDDGLQVDVAFLNGFIGAGMEGNAFEQVDAYDVTGRTLKFPVIEKPFCALRNPGQKLQRSRVLSNRQFRICAKHTELMARLKNRGTAQNAHHVVLGFGDYAPWQDVVNALHKRAEWVVCIDPNIDERLIYIGPSPGQKAREIIGFGSGVGSHGECNYTISTEQFHLSDVNHRLSASVNEIYPGWQANDYKIVVESVIREARRLSGLSLVRATGIGQYIRDFMAYCVSRKVLVGDRDALCDNLVSLDAYHHWFDSAKTDSRPDLLWMVAHVGEDGRIHLDLRLIECKLAKTSDAHLEKARLQIESGLRHLVSVFLPRDNTAIPEDVRPDQRYWWLQLHRLIASKAEITRRSQGDTLRALERLADGDYSVEWRASVLTFWTDQVKPCIELESTWSFSVDGREIDAGVVAAGSDFVRGICSGSEGQEMPWPESKLRIEATVSDLAHLENVEDESGGEEDERGTPPASPSGDGPSLGAKPMSPTAKDDSDDDQQSAEANVATIPDRVLLGNSVRGGRPVYWEFGHPDLSNRHMLIFGTSGMGKTYTVQCLLSELGQLGQNSLIVDYTNGFMKNQLEPELAGLLNPCQHYVQREPLQINPFRQQIQKIDDDSFLEKSSATAQRVAGVFSEVYNFGDQQRSALYQAVKSGIESSGEWGMTLQDLIPCLEGVAEQGGAIATSAGSVISKIRPFLDQDPFGKEELESWEQLFTDVKSRCHIIQLANFARDASRLITEFSLIDLYWFYRSRGTPASPRVVVLDEVQNLDHREESPLSQLLREGRKFGFSLILATQIMSNLKRDERDRLFNAAHKLFFKPADTEIRTYAEIAAVLTGDKATEWMEKFASLSKGECYSLGPSLNEATGELEMKTPRIRISSLTERGL